MCTLLIATGNLNGQGFYVIANRDEALDRPAQVPEIYHRNGTEILAPRDLQAGGTWIGLNEFGVFAGITNRFRLPTKPHHKSRGHLVFRALQESTARAAADAIGALDARDYNGFHLVMADREGAFVVWNDTTRLQSKQLAPGYHIFTERSFDAAPSRRLERMGRRLEKVGEFDDGVRDSLRRWMAEHDADDPLEATCIHADDHNYGTRSSTIVEVGDSVEFAHADGPPCSTEYRPYDFDDRLDQS